MRSPTRPDRLAVSEINTLVILGICPDCGGEHILRGPAGSNFTDYTCGDCEMGFHIRGLDIGFRIGPLPTRACFYNPNHPEKVCERAACGKTFRGPSFYCCIGCAMEDV